MFYFLFQDSGNLIPDDWLYKFAYAITVCTTFRLCKSALLNYSIYRNTILYFANFRSKCRTLKIYPRKNTQRAHLKVRILLFVNDPGSFVIM